MLKNFCTSYYKSLVRDVSMDAYYLENATYCRMSEDNMINCVYKENKTKVRPEDITKVTLLKASSFITDTKTTYAVKGLFYKENEPIFFFHVFDLQKKDKFYAIRSETLTLIKKEEFNPSDYVLEIEAEPEKKEEPKESKKESDKPKDKDKSEKSPKK